MTSIEKYSTDIEFRHLVDMLRGQIEHSKFTPSEIREAVMLAHIMYEEFTLRPKFFPLYWG